MSDGQKQYWRLREEFHWRGEERRVEERGEEREGSSVDYSTLVCQSGSVDYRARGRGGREREGEGGRGSKREGREGAGFVS